MTDFIPCLREQIAHGDGSTYRVCVFNGSGEPASYHDYATRDEAVAVAREQWATQRPSGSVTVYRLTADDTPGQDGEEAGQPEEAK